MQNPATLPNENQTAFSFYGLDNIDRSAPEWHGTGERLHKFRPEVYRIAVDLLAAGRHGKRELCRLLHITDKTIDSIEERERQTLTTLREKAARRNMQIHHMSLDRLEELVPKMVDGAKVAVVAGITGDKSQVFAGEATQRIEHIEPVSIVERFQAYLAEMEKRVANRIGLRAEKTATNAALPADPGRPIGALEDPGRILEVEAEIHNCHTGMVKNQSEDLPDPRKCKPINDL